MADVQFYELATPLRQQIAHHDATVDAVAQQAREAKQALSHAKETIAKLEQENLVRTCLRE